MQAQYVAQPTHLSLGLKDIIMPIRWSLLSDNHLFIKLDIMYQFYKMNIPVEQMKLPIA